MSAAERPTTGPGSAYTPRAATRRRRPALPSHTRTDTALLISRLTPRDLWLAEMLHEHRVLTSHHISTLAFTGHRSANRRLRELYLLHVLDAFRPLRQTGTAPEHYTLGRAGADILAATRGTDPAALGWRKDACARTAFSPTLDHTLAVNTLHVSLAASQYQQADTALETWLSERSAARLWGDWIRPDAYAHYREHNTLLPYFLEYDTGTEPLPRVEAKLAGYAALAATTGTRTPLLIHTSTTRREAALRHRLADTVQRLDLPVATASASYLPDAGPAGPVWLPLATPDTTRKRLAQLAACWTGLTPALTPEALSAPHTASGRAPAWPWRPVPPLPPAVGPN